MTEAARQLMAAALKAVGPGGGFSPAEVGAKVGLDKTGAEAAARVLSNAGVLELGFDSAACFSSDFRKAHKSTDTKPARRKRAAAR